MEKPQQCSICQNLIRDGDTTYCLSTYSTVPIICKESNHYHCTAICSEDCFKFQAGFFDYHEKNGIPLGDRSFRDLFPSNRVMIIPRYSCFVPKPVPTPSQLALEKLKEKDRLARLARKLNKKNNKGRR